MELRRVLVIPSRAARGVEVVEDLARTACQAFPGARVEIGEAPFAIEHARIDVAAWAGDAFDPFAIDVAIARAVDVGEDALAIDGARASTAALHRALREIAVRYQRLFPRRNDASRGDAFDAILARHRAAHDLSKPLVRADFDHARDTWQWVLRLAPAAGLAVQVAALFHDVERLVSEADVRVEHLAADYQAFKDAHARGSSDLVRALLGEILDRTTLDRAIGLIERHERRSEDRDEALLGDADALSFFSVNVCGFLRYYGEAHTRSKIAWTLARMSPRGLAALRSIRMRSDVRALVDHAPLGRAGT